MRKKLKPIPSFQSEAEERAFWIELADSARDSLRPFPGFAWARFSRPSRGAGRSVDSGGWLQHEPGGGVASQFETGRWIVRDSVAAAHGTGSELRGVVAGAL